MIVDVPYFKQSSAYNCGATCLMTVLSFFGKNKSVKFYEKLMNLPENNGVLTIQLAIASIKMGFLVDFYSKSFQNHTILNNEYYHAFFDVKNVNLDSLFVEAKSLGVNLIEKQISTDSLLSFLSRDSLLIVLLDWNIINNVANKGYHGHFVVITGYDDKNVYFHNVGFNDGVPNMVVSKKLFDSARKSRGTDEDFLVIYKK